ncbi:Testis-expressed protein 36 [Merluccius polli]|uniref:Testis-expressed protein 36 n=1 Tax=Merluccius polli TaxID=89951 RepID=A0AA47MBN4_MERPO|nr:Testis-expressed protein 36 [Merluccius polli]
MGNKDISASVSPQSKASPESPFSTHDNRHALRDSICVFSQGLGRKKCADDLSQHSSHFCLCHDADPARLEVSRRRRRWWCRWGGDQYNQAGEEEVVVVHNNNNNKNRRFPRIPQRRSAEAAAARARERPLMWVRTPRLGGRCVPGGPGRVQLLTVAISELACGARRVCVRGVWGGVEGVEQEVEEDEERVAVHCPGRTTIAAS